MRKVKGFTLIELLVVIAIIALLLAILMPAMGRVKKQSRKVACQANLKQCAAGLFRAAVAGPEQHGPFLCEPAQRDDQRRFPRLDGQADRPQRTVDLEVAP